MTERHTLVRFFDDGERTIGLFKQQFWTMERPWLDNALRVSCIPAGVYTVVRHDSPSQGDCFWVQDVPERTHILIHVANWAHELIGCIAPGLGVNLTPTPMVTSSRNALDELLRTLPDEWELEIVDGHKI